MMIAKTPPFDIQTMKVKNIPEGYELCHICNGECEEYFSCCTGEVVDSDIQRCPDCKENVGLSKCEDCEGTGLVITTNNFKIKQ